MTRTHPAGSTSARLPIQMLVAALFAAVLIPGAASAVQVVIDLGGSPATSCNETWTDSDVVLSFVNTEPEDCDGGGNCSFDAGASNAGLFPGRLNLDLSGIQGVVTSAEVDVQDFCGTNCTRAFIYDGATIVDTAGNTGSGAQTLTLLAGGTAIDRLAISSCEGFATQVRLEVEPSLPAVPISSPVGVSILVVSMLLLGAGFALRRAPTP